MLDKSDPVVQDAVFGRQVEDFFTSDIGDYLLKRAEEERTQAMEKLAYIRPSNVNQIKQLQNQIKVVESIKGWLADAIIKGRSAVEVLEEQNG